MPLSISRLRRWFAGGAIFVCLAVLGTYFYARHRVQNALKQVPGKIGIEIQQSAQEFTISKSEEGRTLFKLQASKAIQFKQGGRAELHDVTITLYGRDSSRFDQVYGQDFEYDQQSGDVTSKGEVSIDLQANPQGILHPDQSPPKELKNPLHLKTTGLVFNQKTGNAWTPATVEFRVPQASGSAVGARYMADDGMLTLESKVRMVVNSETPSTVVAEQAILQKAPREIYLRRARAESQTQRGQADQVTLFLKNDNSLDRMLANGNVRVESKDNGEATHIAANSLEVRMKADGQTVRDASLAGDVQLRNEGPQAIEAHAGKADLDFGSHNTVTTIHADQQVVLSQHRKNSSKTAQEVQVTAPAMDFVVVGGRRLSRAETRGVPQILLSANDSQGMTRVTSDKFIANFDTQGQLSDVRGEAHAKVVTTPLTQGRTLEPERVSTSDRIEASFRPGIGVQSLVQAGHFTYTSGTQQALAAQGRYTPADQILELSGSPRISDSGMTTTANTIRLNRETGVGQAFGDVKTTYNDLKPQPDGALLASSDPVHVTAQTMTAHNGPLVVTYTGNARLWQNATVIEAPCIQFQKDQRTITADAKGTQKVSTVLVGTDKSGKPTPVTVTSNHLAYRDSDRKARFEGGVSVRGADLAITSQQMDVFLSPTEAIERRAFRPVQGGQVPATGETPVAPQSQNLSKLEKIVASGSVLIIEPNRRASGNLLTYTTSDDKFVLTGGPPSIFDAEHGKITGVSLTLFRHDDRVVVDGDSSSPAVTQTRVVR
jgi:lipopolysaccharide export system protein LptA